MNCGAALAADARFCTSCGTVVAASAPASPSAAAPAAVAAPPRRSTSIPWIPIGLALAYTAYAASVSGDASPERVLPTFGIALVLLLTASFVLRRMRGCVATVLVIVLLLIGVGAAGVLAYQNGIITDRMILTALGRGPADLEIVNMREDRVSVEISEVAAPADETPYRASLALDRYGADVHVLPRPGRYDIVFKRPSPAQELGRCRLGAESGATYQFIPLRDGRIIIDRTDQDSGSVREHIVATSSRCR